MAYGGRDSPANAFAVNPGEEDADVVEQPVIVDNQPALDQAQAGNYEGLDNNPEPEEEFDPHVLGHDQNRNPVDDEGLNPEDRERFDNDSAPVSSDGIDPGSAEASGSGSGSGSGGSSSGTSSSGTSSSGATSACVSELPSQFETTPITSATASHSPSCTNFSEAAAAAAANPPSALPRTRALPRQPDADSKRHSVEERAVMEKLKLLQEQNSLSDDLAVKQLAKSLVLNDEKNPPAMQGDGAAATSPKDALEGTRSIEVSSPKGAEPPSNVGAEVNVDNLKAREAKTSSARDTPSTRANPSATSKPTKSATGTQSETGTRSGTGTSSTTGTPSETGTPSKTRSETGTPSATNTQSATSTQSETLLETNTPSATGTASATSTPSATSTRTSLAAEIKTKESSKSAAAAADDSQSSKKKKK